MPHTSTSLRTDTMRGLTGALRPWLTLILVCVVFSASHDFRAAFWQKDYLPNIVQQSARTIVLAVGMSFVVFTGGIDLSVGAVLALSGVGLALAMTGSVPMWLCAIIALPMAIGAGWLVRNARRPEWMAVCAFVVTEVILTALVGRAVSGGVAVAGAVLVGLGIGVACGLLNGLIVSVGRVPSFVMTLGMLSAARGLTLYATDSTSVPARDLRFMALGQGMPLALITLGVVALAAVLLARMRPGRLIMALGGNEQASRLSGVDVVGFKTLAYALSGLAAGVAAVIVTAKFGIANTGAGTGAELDAIAAVVIGGASLAGGQGSIIGALVGALTITVIEAGLVLTGVQDTLQPVILGAVIVLTVFVDQIRRRTT